jgi:MFS family permease
VTAAFITAVIVQFLVRGETSVAVPYYGIGVFMPIMAMGLAIREHIRRHETGRARKWGMFGASMAAGLAAFIFIGQIVGKWPEGGWVVLITMTLLILVAHAVLISPAGYRDLEDIHRIIQEKSHVQGPMGEIVTWQSLRAQEYRYNLLVRIAQFAELFGVRRPMRFEKPRPAGEYEAAIHAEQAKTPSLLQTYLDNQPKPEPKLGGVPPETAEPEKPEGVE